MTDSPHPIARWRAEQEPKRTQEQLASALGVAAMTVYRWEKGAVPRRKYWPKLTEVTGIPIKEILLASDLREAA